MVIRSISSFFDEVFIQSKKLRGVRSSSSFFDKKLFQSKQLRGGTFKLEFFRSDWPQMVPGMRKLDDLAREHEKTR